MRTDPTAAKLGMMVGATLLLIGTICIVWSYNTGDPAWDLINCRLGHSGGPRYGMYIQLGLLWLTVPLGVLVVCGSFGDEVTELLRLSGRKTLGRQLRERQSRRPTLVTCLRIVFLLAAVLWGGGEVARAVGRTAESLPAALVARGQAADAYANVPFKDREKYVSADQKLRSSLAAHHIYAPVIVIYYSIIVPLTLIIPCFAIFHNDLPRLLEARTSLREAVSSYRRAERVQQRFHQFRDQMYARSMRYLNLFAVLAIIVLYMQFVGNRSISPEAAQSVAVALAIPAASALFLAFVWYLYHDVWQTTSRYLDAIGALQTSMGDDDLPLRFVRRLFRQNLSGYVVALVLLVPLKDMLPFG